MPDPTDFEEFPVFGDNSSKEKPGDQKYAAGFQPGDVLPAEWLNWFLNTISKGYNELVDNAVGFSPDSINILTNKTIAYTDNTLTGVQPTITGAATSITSSDLDTSKVLVSDANGKVSASSVPAKMIGVGGVVDVANTLNTANFAWGAGGGAGYTIHNRMCTVYISRLIQHTDIRSGAVITIPQAKIPVFNNAYTGGGNPAGLIYTNPDGTALYFNSNGTTGVETYGSLTYPISDNL